MDKFDDEDGPKIAFKLSAEDHRALTLHLCSSLLAGGWRRRLAQSSGAGLIVGLIGSTVQTPTSYLTGAAVTLVSCLILAQVRTAQTSAALAPKESGYVLCGYEMVLRSSGIWIETPGWKGETSWSAVEAFEETADHLFLRLDSSVAYPVPKRAFADQEALADFETYVRNALTSARSDARAHG